MEVVRTKSGISRVQRLTLFLIAALAGAVPAASASAGVQLGTEAWSDFKALPGLATTPDWNTAIYQSYYSAGPAHETVIRGRAPSARYWSFAVLDPANREISNLSDFEIETDALGRYEVRVRLDCTGVDDCLETLGDSYAGVSGRILYRMYVPDGDVTGGVGLPQVEYRPIGAPAPDVQLPSSGESWFELNRALVAPLEPGGAGHDAQAGPTGLEQPVPEGKTGPEPQARRFDGLGGAQVEALERAGVPAEVIALIQQARGTGGFGATQDNAYVTMDFTTQQGNLVVRAKAPTYRAQHEDARNSAGRSDGSEQVRYWSVCATAALRTMDCLRDEQVALSGEDYFTIVVAPSCPVAGYVNCLRAGPIAYLRNGNVVYRNQLAREGFANERGPAECPSEESQFCGEYALTGRYVTRP